MFIKDSQQLASLTETIHIELQRADLDVDIVDVRLVYAIAHGFTSYENFEAILPFFPRVLVDDGFDSVLCELTEGRLEKVPPSVCISDIQRRFLCVPLWSQPESMISIYIDWNVAWISKPFLRHQMECSNLSISPDPDEPAGFTYHLPIAYLDEDDYFCLVEKLNPLVETVSSIRMSKNDLSFGEKEVELMEEVESIIENYCDDLPGKDFYYPSEYYAGELEVRYSEENDEVTLLFSNDPCLNSKSTDQDIRAFIGAEVANQSYPTSPSEMYFLFTRILWDGMDL